jgi:hypothetical protein
MSVLKEGHYGEFREVLKVKVKVGIWGVFGTAIE